MPQAVPLPWLGTIPSVCVENFKSECKWSLDASYGKALESGEFRRDEIVCTKTLYNYVDLGLLPIKENTDLRLFLQKKAHKSEAFFLRKPDLFSVSQKY